MEKENIKLKQIVANLSLDKGRFDGQLDDGGLAKSISGMFNVPLE